MTAPFTLLYAPFTVAEPTTLNADAALLVPAEKSMLTFPPTTVILVIWSVEEGGGCDPPLNWMVASATVTAWFVPGGEQARHRPK
jgi:hypothetical protein